MNAAYIKEHCISVPELKAQIEAKEFGEVTILRVETATVKGKFKLIIHFADQEQISRRMFFVATSQAGKIFVDRRSVARQKEIALNKESDEVSEWNQKISKDE